MQPNIEQDTSIEQSNTQKVTALLRLIIRAIDLHSHYLSKEVGLTIPQLLILQEIRVRKDITPTEVSIRIKSSKATVSGIIERLREKGYIKHTRNQRDRRQIYLSLTKQGEQMLMRNPLPIQQQFIERFESIGAKQQKNMLESLEVLATLMFEASSAAQDLERWTTRQKQT